MKAYAKEQGVPPPNSNSNLKGFVSDYNAHPTNRTSVSPSFHTFLTISNILVHCSIFFTFLSASYYIYKAVYKNGKKNPIYGAYWVIVVFLTDLFFVTIYYEEDATQDPVLITFLVLEAISSILMACTSTYIFEFIQSTEKESLVFPIPVVSDADLQIWKCKFKKGYILCTVVVKAIAMWFPVATLHAFVYNIIPNRAEAFLTSPLETFVELVFYLLLAICFFVVLNLPFYIEKPRCCTTWKSLKKSCGSIMSFYVEDCGNTREIFKENFVYIIKLLNICTLLALISIAAFSTRYVALTLSQSQDSDARLLIAVLPTVGVTAVVALKWPYIKQVIKKLHPQETGSANDNTSAGIAENNNSFAAIDM